VSDIFVAYVEDDRARAARLIRALQAEGFGVWSHEDLPSGKNWHVQIESALETAKCVVVLWTKSSVGPAGEFVREEARWAKSRGIIVPVLLQKVDPPLGFGEIQAIDLRRWGGSRRNAFFRDLCATLRARLAGTVVPAPRGPRKRLMQRITYGALASGLTTAAVFGFNLFAAQSQLCAIPVIQPLVSDACGAWGFGGRPTKAERLAWESREPGSCQALRDHVEAYPEGAFREAAASLIAARQVMQTEVWEPSERRLVLYVGPSTDRQAGEAEARAVALERAGREADRLCRGFAATTSFRLTSASPEAQVWDCTASASGVACGFDGEAVCQLEERRVVETETCQGD
jgi:hypothetical protein